MKLLRLISLFLILSVAIGHSSVEAQETDATLISSTEDLLETLDVTEFVSDDNFSDLIVTVNEPRAGAVSPYTVDFKIEQFTLELIKNGGVKFAFPDGFDLTRITSISISDNYLPLELGVERFTVSSQLLTVYLRQVKLDETAVLDESTLIEVTLSIADIGNPLIVGDYQIAAVAFKQNNAVVAGPIFSMPFSIVANNVAAITVSPAADLTLRAGESTMFSAEGYDEFGNKIEGLIFDWTLDCDNCIGYMTNSTFTATTTGSAHVLASLGDIVGSSGLITVIPGEIAGMTLAVSDTQFVGYPLRGFGSISLYDSYGNLKTDYSLLQQPISLTPSAGVLTPASLTDDALLSAGIVNLLPAEIKYTGLSGAIGVTADNSAVISNSVQISFNGYDIPVALGTDGETINHVYDDGSDVVDVADVVVWRGGNLTPGGPVTLVARFLSSPTSVTVSIPVSQLINGTDTITVTLPDIDHVADEDTLLLTLTAQFNLGGISYTTVDTALFPVAVLRFSGFSFVDGSFKPDTVLEDVSFEMSFDVFSESFALPIDSVSLRIRLWDAIDGNQLALLYEGGAIPYEVGDGTLLFSGLQAVVASTAVPDNGYYPVDIAFSLFTGSTVLSLDERWVDSLYVRKQVALSVDPASLEPTSVSAGSIVEFRFILTAVTDIPLDFVTNGSSFTVTGTGFSTSTSLNLPGNLINPGENEFTTEGVFIPESQLGSTLGISAEIRYNIPGVFGEQVFVTDFGQIRISVSALPAIKVVEVRAVAPNTPRVNVGQQFQISARIANMSPTPAQELQVTLNSDGSSVFEAGPILIDLDRFDTTTVVWNVTAASEPNPAEIFIVAVDPRGVSLLPPDDNVALVTIETVADLDLTYTLFGVEGGLIDYGNELTLTVELVNRGMAQVSTTEYLLVAEGFDTNGPDTLRGNIGVDRHIAFSFFAPQRDTTLNLFFSLTAVPIDLNTLMPAQIGDTTFSILVRVISAGGGLYIEATSIGTSLVLPGREKEIVQLDMTNTGLSSITRLRLEKIVLLVKDAQGNPLEAMSVISIGNCGFFEGDVKISTLTAGDSALVFGFDEFILEPQQLRSLVLKAEFLATEADAVMLDMARDGVVAKFIEGPNAGMSPTVSSNVEEGESLMAEALTIKDASLEGSFLIENNPFNPNDGPVNFSYELPQNADVEFRIFTITGEEVYARDFAAGSIGGMAGENVIEWNGRNDKDRIVLNGVYVALMKNVTTGETARIKIAVVK